VRPPWRRVAAESPPVARPTSRTSRCRSDHSVKAAPTRARAPSKSSKHRHGHGQVHGRSGGSAWQMPPRLPVGSRLQAARWYSMGRPSGSSRTALPPEVQPPGHSQRVACEGARTEWASQLLSQLRISTDPRCDGVARVPPTACLPRGWQSRRTLSSGAHRVPPGKENGQPAARSTPTPAWGRGATKTRRGQAAGKRRARALLTVNHQIKGTSLVIHGPCDDSVPC